MKKFYLIILINIIISCNTEKQTKVNYRNLLTKNCWVLSKKINLNSNDTIYLGENSECFQYKFRIDGSLNISGIETKYILKKNGFLIDNDFYKIIKVNKITIETLKYNDEFPVRFNIFEKMNCDSLNYRLKDLNLPVNCKKI